MPLPFIADVYVNGWPVWAPPPMRVAQGAALLTVLAAVKYYAGGAINRADRAMHGRVVMITGGTAGIGAAVAEELARKGAQVVLLTTLPPSDPFVAEHVEDLRERTGNRLVYAEQCDLASLHSIRTFATKWIDNLPVRRLDMVILCAAVQGQEEVVEVVEAEEEDRAKRGKEKQGKEKRGKKEQKEQRAKRGQEKRGQEKRGEKEKKPKTTIDGLERTWAVNYLANFHLLGILSPALRSQPFDRDVRVVITTCSSYIGSPPLVENDSTTTNTTTTTTTPTSVAPWTPRRAYARSKLALMVFARAYQQHLDAYKRPDGLPGNVRVVVVDPGFARTPGTRQYIGGTGSILGLLFYYVLFYPVWWLLLKSAEQAAQSVLFAALEGNLRRMQDLTAKAGDQLATPTGKADLLYGKVIKECRLVDVARRDVLDDAVAKTLWEESDKLVEETEKTAAQLRKQAEAAKNDADKKAQEAEKASEIEALGETIKKGKAKEAAAAAATAKGGSQGKQGQGKKKSKTQKA